METHEAVSASTFLGDLSLVLVGAAVIGLIFRRLGQPAVLGYLLAGFVVGPYVPIPLFADHQRIEALAEFGVVLVMLSVGLEFSIRRLGQVLPRIGVPALIQMSTLAWLGSLVGRTLGWGTLESVFLGACLAVSSTMVVAEVFKEIPVPQAVRELSFGILVAQDLVAILAIAALTAAATATGVAQSEVVTTTAVELSLFLLVLLVAGLLLVPRTIRYLTEVAGREVMVVAVVGLGFGLALIAQQVGYSVALGAFVAGALIAQSGEGRRMGALVAPIRDLFAAVFFVAVGMSIDPRVIGEVLPIGLLVAGAIVVGQLVSVGIGGILTGRSLSTSLRSGASLGQIGEFSFIIAGVGVSSGAVRPELASIVVLASLITTFTTPIVLRSAESLALAIDRRLPRRVRRLLTLYPSWLDQLSKRARSSGAPQGWRRLLIALGVDIVALIGLTWLTTQAYRRFADILARKTGLAVEWAIGLVMVLAVLLALPFAVGLVRTGRRLGRELAESALPRRADTLDMAREPRRAMTHVLEVVVALVAVSLFVSATQLVLPAGWGIVAFVVAGFAIARAFWKTSDALDGHVRAGAQAFAEVLLRPPAERFEEVEEVLPGLGELSSLAVASGAAGVGKTLAELDLRGRTGATVLAVRRREQLHDLPGADWKIEAGDVLGLTGSADAVDRARRQILGE